MNKVLTSEVIDTLQTVLLRCVECAALYPGIEVDAAPRYRCNCGGTLDVEMKLALPKAQIPSLQNALASRNVETPLVGVLDGHMRVMGGYIGSLRQLLAERAA